MNKGFTLAETLITLVIIGVVAAITVPNMVIQWQKNTTVKKLLKTYSTISNALNKAQYDYGYHRKWDLQAEGGTTSERADNFVKKYLIPYLKVNKYCGTSSANGCAFAFGDATDYRKRMTNDVGQSYARFIMPDGAMVGVTINHTTENDSANFYIDVDGYSKGPNKYGRDIFLYYLVIRQDNGYMHPNCFLKGPMSNLILKPQPWCPTTREALLSDSTWENCKNGRRKQNCTRLIMMDGWKISDDYPW